MAAPRCFKSDKLLASHIDATDGEGAARKDHSGARCAAVTASRVDRNGRSGNLLRLCEGVSGVAGSARRAMVTAELNPSRAWHIRELCLKAFMRCRA